VLTPETPPPEIPSWAVSGLIWIFVALGGVVVTVIGWLQRMHILTTKEHSKQISELKSKQETFATVTAMNELEQRIPSLVTRTELVAYMAQLREDTEKRSDQMREDRLRMHDENQKGIAAVVEQVGAVRTDIRAVHARVDTLYTNK
jgi:hypothetical protein